MGDRDPMSDFETQVRDALQRDGERIRPEADGLARIRERTASATSRRGRMWLIAGAAGLATAAAVAGAVIVSGDLFDGSGTPDPVAPTVVPSDPPTPQPTDRRSQPVTQAMTVPVYYVGDTTSGSRLFREFHRVESTSSKAVTALTEMFDREPLDPDYSSPWAPGIDVLSVEHAGGQVTVDLSSVVLETDVPAATAALFVQQLVYTVQGALQSTDPVQILVEGSAVADISGSPTAEALARAPAIEVQAMTWITSPPEGATVPSGFTVEGVANAFEANVRWELLREDGTVVDDGFSTAAEGQAFSPYTFKVRDDVPAGSYTLKVFQSSPEDGSETFVDTKSITIK